MSFAGGFQADTARVVPERVVHEMRQHDQGGFARHSDFEPGAAVGGDGRIREPFAQLVDHAGKTGTFILRRSFGAGEFAQPLRHGFQSRSVTEDVAEKSLLLGRS